jgi:hypothetical protein
MSNNTWFGISSSRSIQKTYSIPSSSTKKRSVVENQCFWGTREVCIKIFLLTNAFGLFGLVDWNYPQHHPMTTGRVIQAKRTDGPFCVFLYRSSVNEIKHLIFYRWYVRLYLSLCDSESAHRDLSKKHTQSLVAREKIWSVPGKPGFWGTRECCNKICWLGNVFG